MDNARNIDHRNGRTRLRYAAWDDLRFPAQGINPPGTVSDPDVDASTGLLLFSASATNMVAGVAQMPHAWKEGTAIRPHIHLKHTDDSAGDSVWRFEYDIATPHGDFSGVYTSEDIVVASPESATTHTLSGFSEIDMGGNTLSTIILWKLSRIGGDAEDTYAETVALMEFDIHYQIDAFGSKYEFIK